MVTILKLSPPAFIELDHYVTIWHGGTHFIHFASSCKAQWSARLNCVCVWRMYRNKTYKSNKYTYIFIFLHMSTCVYIYIMYNYILYRKTWKQLMIDQLALQDSNSLRYIYIYISIWPMTSFASGCPCLKYDDTLSVAASNITCSPYPITQMVDTPYCDCR